jgi:hypothetical protein
MNEHFINCIRNNIKISPVYFSKTQKINAETYKRNNWYIQVEKDNQTVIYNKSIHEGTVLTTQKMQRRTKKNKDKDTVNWMEAMNATYKHFSDLVDGIS